MRLLLSLSLSVLSTLLSFSLVAQNNCLSFDGTDDYIYVPDFSLSGDFTIEFRFRAGKASLVPFEERIISFGPSNRMEIGLEEVNGETRVWYYDQPNGEAYLTTQNVRDGAWHHFALVYEGEWANAYLDGSWVLGFTVTPSLGEYGPFLRLGAWSGALGTSTWYNGLMDEVRIWGFPLSAEKIAEGFDCQISGEEEGLLAYWDFNQGDAGGNNADELILIDGSNEGKDGEVTGFILSGNFSNWVDSGSEDVFCDFVGTSELLPEDNSLLVYPNPTTGQVHLVSDQEGIRSIRIFTAQGILLEKVQISINEQVNLNKYPSGLYLFEVTDEVSKTVRKVIKT